MHDGRIQQRGDAEMWERRTMKQDAAEIQFPVSLRTAMLPATSVSNTRRPSVLRR